MNQFIKVLGLGMIIFGSLTAVYCIVRMIMIAEGLS